MNKRRLFVQLSKRPCLLIVQFALVALFASRLFAPKITVTQKLAFLPHSKSPALGPEALRLISGDSFFVSNGPRFTWKLPQNDVTFSVLLFESV